MSSAYTYIHENPQVLFNDGHAAFGDGGLALSIDTLNNMALQTDVGANVGLPETASLNESLSKADEWKHIQKVVGWIFDFVCAKK